MSITVGSSTCLFKCLIRYITNDLVNLFEGVTKCSEIWATLCCFVFLNKFIVTIQLNEVIQGYPGSFEVTKVNLQFRERMMLSNIHSIDKLDNRLPNSMVDRVDNFCFHWLFHRRFQYMNMQHTCLAVALKEKWVKCKVDGHGLKWTALTTKSERSWAKLDGMRKWTIQRVETERSFDHKLLVWKPSTLAQMTVMFGSRPFTFGWTVHVRMTVYFMDRSLSSHSSFIHSSTKIVKIPGFNLFMIDKEIGKISTCT